MARGKHRQFCATYNNPVPGCYEEIQEEARKLNATTLCIGKEWGSPPIGTRDPLSLDLQGEEMQVQGRGTFHYQVAMSFENEILLRTVMSSMPQRGHWEIQAKGSNPQANMGYPMKGESPKYHPRAKDGLCPLGHPAQSETRWTFEVPGENWDGMHFGDFPAGQGKHLDYDQLVKDVIKGGVTVEDLIQEPGGLNLYTQHGRALEICEGIADRQNFRTEMTQGVWYYGDTGRGKSHRAYEDFDPRTHFVVNGDALKGGGFWDGLTRTHEVAILNEFRGELPFGTLMELTDKWPKTVNIKCKRPIHFNIKKFIITTPVSPEETYRDFYLKNKANGKWEQFLERFEVFELVGTSQRPPKKARIQINVDTGEEKEIEVIELVDDLDPLIF